MVKKGITVFCLLLIVLGVSAFASADNGYTTDLMLTNSQETVEQFIQETESETKSENWASSSEAETGAQEEGSDSADTEETETKRRPPIFITSTVKQHPEDDWAPVNPEGMTVLTRFNTPKGYARKDDVSGSFAEFVRSYPLKPNGTPLLYYDGSQVPYQKVNMAVFDLPLERRDLQQCADSVMRFYAEYYWNRGCADQLSFYYTNGVVSEYTRWRNGEQLVYANKSFSWVPRGGYDDSYQVFVKFLHHAFAYAGTRSMDRYESEPISMDEMEIGDVFLEGGSPGHIVMVVDICYDKDGHKAFLLADGHTPAMNFHVMKNMLHPSDPWFYEEEITYPFETFAHIYSEGALQRLTYSKQLNPQ